MLTRTVSLVALSVIATVAPPGSATTTIAPITDFPYQIENDIVNVYWYIFADDTIKILFDRDFGSDGIDQKYLGIGLRLSNSGMGPGTFYVGDTDNMDVAPYELTTATSAQPTEFADSSVIETGC